MWQKLTHSQKQDSRSGQPSISDVPSVLLLTCLWTSSARMHFNGVSLKENVHGPKCWVLDLDGTAARL